VSFESSSVMPLLSSLPLHFTVSIATIMQPTYSAHYRMGADQDVLQASSSKSSKGLTLRQANPLHYPIVIDSGASVSLSPCFADFIHGICPSSLVDLRGLDGTVAVSGEGFIEWCVFDIHNIIQTIWTRAFFVPSAEIRLFSTQSYFQEGNSGSFEMEAIVTKLTLHDGSCLFFPYNPDMNIPLMLPSIEKRMANACLTASDLQGLTQEVAFLSVSDESNQNLTRAQKELLQWHWRLGHCHFQWVQSLAAHPRIHDDGLDKPVLLTKNDGVSSVAPPLCAACKLAKQSQ